MNKFSLYIKTHRKTGLRYLGQTKKDPFKYLGSGVDWIKHLKEFGDDVHTEILFQTDDKEQRNRLGRYYSALWHVVTAADDFGNKLWANRIPETGGGAGAKKGTTHRQDSKDKMSVSQRLVNANPEVRKKRSASMKKALSEIDYKIKVSGKNNHHYDHEIYEFVHESGTKEKCTRQELIKKYNLEPRLFNRMMVGGRKSHRGWSLVSKFVRMKDRA